MERIERSFDYSTPASNGRSMRSRNLRQVIEGSYPPAVSGCVNHANDAAINGDTSTVDELRENAHAPSPTARRLTPLTAAVNDTSGI